MSDQKNSTDQSPTSPEEDSKQKSSEDSPPQKVKKKGPLRLEALIPFVLFCAALAVYGHFFLAGHLRAMLELAGSYGYGAQIDIEDLHLDLAQGSFTLSDIQVTDIDQPERNLLHLGEIRGQINWDALLRAKLVISDAGIENIRLNTARETPGKIFRSESETEEVLAGRGSQVLKNTQKELQGNIFGDAAALLDGSDPTAQLDQLKGSLETTRRLNAIQADLDKKEKNWRQKLDQLPNQGKIDSLKRRFAALKFNSKDPRQMAASIKKAQALLKEADRDIKTLSAARKTLQTDISGFGTQFKGLEETRQKDIAALGQRIALPQLDTKTIAYVLFGDEIAKYQGQVERYLSLAREYLPQSDPSEEPDSAEPSPALTPKERALGKTFEFLTKKSYPLFWLQRATISSQASDEGLSANLQGVLSDVSTNPRHLQKTTTLNIEGDIPKQGLQGLKALVTLDHTQERARHSLQASIARFPIAAKDFSNGPDVQFGLRQAQGRSQISGVLVGNQMKMVIKNRLTQVDYKVKAKSKDFEKVLQRVANDVPIVTVNAELIGSPTSPKVSLSTNLARAIQRSLEAQVKERIAEARQKLKNYVDQQISQNRQKVAGEFKKLKSQYLGELDRIKAQIDGLKGQQTAKVNQAKKSTTKKVEKKAKKELKKLLKKFNF